MERKGQQESPMKANYESSRTSVGPCVISCQMFVKSEFPLDSALVCDSDQQKFGWHFFRNL